MESRFQRLFLVLMTFVTSIILSLAIPSYAQDDVSNEKNSASDDIDARTIEDIVTPDIERRKIKENKIDSENIELGIYGGVLNIEDFGSNDTFGITAGYHISEDFFVELQYGQSQGGRTSFDILSGGSDILTEEERELTHLHLSIAYQLHGELFLGKNRAYNTNFFIIGGIGNTEFGGNEFFTTNFGGGLRIFFADWIAGRVSFRNYAFSHSLLGEKKSIQNLETQIGLSFYF